MNPRAFLLIALAVIAVLLVLGGGVYWLISRNAGVRRKEFEAMRRERNNALDALDKIEESVRTWSDIDSVLAASIRPVLHEHAAQRREIAP